MLDLDSDNDAPYVRILVSNVTNPIAAYSAAFNWYIETVRFQTGNVIERGAYVAGPTVTPGIIAASSLSPTWGTNVNAIVKGMVLLTDFSVTLTNPTPAVTMGAPIGALIKATIVGTTTVIGP
jgi:hypothetical protein